MYADNLEAHVTDLAYHFFQAEEWTAALEYSRRAGEQAQLLYAPREAQEHFSRALEAAQHLGSQPPLELYRARGQAADMLGDFERAKADFEQALALARERSDRPNEWQLLIYLGFLWASRDYERTGEYFERALGLARTIGDQDLVARSLNRIGNWYVNIDRPGEGLHHHQEALDTFQELGDQNRIAETLDLMGMASYLNSDVNRGVSYYERAVSLFQKLDNRQGLASSLALLSQRAGSCNFDIVVASGGALRQAAREGDQALKMAREIGYRAGEAFALVMLSMLWGAEGDYGRALDNAQMALEIAEEIHHRQWQSAAQCALGAIEVEFFAFDTARSHLERALDLAQQTRSTYWIANATRFLARGYSLQGDSRSAQSILSAISELSMPPETQARRLLWTAKIDATLAQGNPQRALDLTNELIASIPGISEKTVIPYLWYLRGQALLALQHTQEAAIVLRQARQAASQQGARSVLWRINATLGEAEQMQDEPKQAQAEFAAARRLVEELAATIPGGGFREEFLLRTSELIPGSKRMPRVRVKTIAELTLREQQVARLIAEGKSNRAIAETLVLSERTVESHVSSILSKLGATSRAQIAVWAKEEGNLLET
jgi:DNA-binding CsgD family transcriptional regulator